MNVCLVNEVDAKRVDLSYSPTTHCCSAQRRYERFEPVTVRAAARVLQLQRAGVISARDAAFYLRELVSLDAHAGDGAVHSLFRAARRRSAGCPAPASAGRGHSKILRRPFPACTRAGVACQGTPARVPDSQVSTIPRTR